MASIAALTTAAVSSGTAANAGILTFSAMAAAMQIAGGASADKAANAQAEAFREAGRAEADDKRRANAKLFAEQQVAFAGAGVDTQTGSPLDVLSDTVAEAELAALRIQFGREGQARAVEERGRQARVAGITGGVGSVLGGGMALGQLGAMRASAGTTPEKRTG